MMLHFAELNSDNTVKRVIVVHESDTLDENGISQESKGIEFCQNLFGGTWIQTFEDASQRKRYAGIGDYYDSVQNAFIPRKPYSSWIFDESIWNWIAPKPMPTEGYWTWSESALDWLNAE